MGRQSVPQALLVRGRFDDPIFIVRPEAKIAWFLQNGWRVVLKDSDVLTFNPPRFVADDDGA